MSAADELIDRLPFTSLILGKGGVGKSTCAAAIALRASERGERTLLLTTDPAQALPLVLNQPVGTSAGPVSGAPNLSARLFAAAELRAAFMARWGTVIRTILDRGTYLDDADITPLVDATLPGSDEIFAALELAKILREHDGAGRIVVDTAPTGHTLRLLNLPRTFRGLVRLLEAMQGKHRYMVRTLTRGYRADDADAFIAEMQASVSTLESALRDASRCAAVVVTNREHLVLEETARYLTALRGLDIHVAAIVWNRTDGHSVLQTDAAQFTVPPLEEPPVGIAGLQRWAAAMTPGHARARTSRPPTKRTMAGQRSSTRSREPKGDSGTSIAGMLVKPLTIIAGKGGVGKTTIASALAIHSAETRRTLVVSTDPAPSLADALAQDVPDAVTPVEGIPRLHARQLDASAAFARLRADYASRVDALFEGLVARGVDLTHDRAIVRDLLALAPPGIDEVYALSGLADALFGNDYDCVIVDPAPTGHLLRLLEMPKLALGWSHQLLRLMLKYKDVAGLGDTAQELLAFARSLRALDEMIHDARRCAVVIVTVDQPVVREETDRLANEMKARGVAIAGMVENRAKGTAAAAGNGERYYYCPETRPAPVGVDALRGWLSTWTHG